MGSLNGAGAKVEPRSLESLFGLLQEAKAMEALAKDERLAIESEIIRHVEDPPTSGSLTRPTQAPGRAS